MALLDRLIEWAPTEEWAMLEVRDAVLPSLLIYTLGQYEDREEAVIVALEVWSKVEKALKRGGGYTGREGASFYSWYMRTAVNHVKESWLRYSVGEKDALNFTTVGAVTVSLY